MMKEKEEPKNELLVDVWSKRGIKYGRGTLFLEKKDEFDFRLVEFEVKVEYLSRNILERCEDMDFVSEVRTRHVDLAVIRIE